jgi:hypothetical protein
VFDRPLNGFYSGSVDFRIQIAEFGLGGARTRARTHNQRLKRAIVSIFKILVISILRMPIFFVAPFVARDIEKAANKDIVGQVSLKSGGAGHPLSKQYRGANRAAEPC